MPCGFPSSMYFFRRQKVNLSTFKRYSWFPCFLPSASLMQTGLQLEDVDRLFAGKDEQETSDLFTSRQIKEGNGVSQSEFA